jgi:hypothetical protein
MTCLAAVAMPIRPEAHWRSMAHAGHAGRQAGGQGDLARDVGAGRALLQGRAHDHVLDLGRVDAGAGHGVLHGMSAQLLSPGCR